MTIRTMGKEEIIQRKVDDGLLGIYDQEKKLLETIKLSIDALFDLDTLQEIKEYVEQAIIEWEQEPIDDEEEDEEE